MPEILGPVAFMLGLYFVVPILLAKVLRASWRAVGIAYPIWFGLLALFGLSTLGGGASLDESVGWPIIMGMFLTIPAVPVIVVVLKLFRVK